MKNNIDDPLLSYIEKKYLKRSLADKSVEFGLSIFMGALVITIILFMISVFGLGIACIIKSILWMFR